MKKNFTLLFISFSLFSFAQQQETRSATAAPIIEATYLPVRGTSIIEVWDVTPNTITVPDTGTNKVWDYSSEFINGVDTFTIKTFHPDTLVNGLSYSQYFPTATHASFLRSPIDNITDSLYSYYIIDTLGLHMLGGFNIRAQTSNQVGYDTTSIISPSELMTPTQITYGMEKNDTSKYITYGKYINIPIKIRGTKTKVMSGVGYGTLTMPNGRKFYNVLLARQIIHTVDSVFHGIIGNYLNSITSDFIDYSFFRNNTFGTSYLMYLNANSANTLIGYGWYTLPVDFGSISGTVFTDGTENTVVTNGVAYLYREYSNFSKNDILDTSILDSYGNYNFDSIPYGQYRVSVRPDLTMYPNNLTTYFGDTTKGNYASPIITSVQDSNSIGHNIHILYHTDSVGLGSISGTLDLQQSLGIIANPDLNNGIRAIDPIPGVDIIVRSRPGGIAMREIKTDPLGYYSIGDLDNGAYDLFVDIPGLLMKGTYEFEIAGATAINCLDFTSGMDSIHHYVCQDITTNVQKSIKSANLLDVYPNPYKFATTVKINVSVKSTVLLEVYNVLGEKIQTLDNSEKIAGSYSYNFSAKALNYSAGLYFIKLSMGNNVSVLKIMEQ